jgi:hypothetical protein
MDISIEGLVLYRPTASSKREFLTDNYGENIGVKDTVTIKDVVTSQDSSDLIAFLDSVIGFVKSKIDFISISYGSDAQARITGFDVDSDSDFVNKLSYSISFEACPEEVPIVSKWPFSAKAGVRSLTYSESIDHPKDMNLISLPNGRRYYNKIPVFVFSAQITCVSVDNQVKPRDKSIRALRAIKKIAPFILHEATKKYVGYGIKIVGLEESYSDEGSASIEIKVNLIPPDSNFPNVLLDSNEVTVNDFFGEKQYSTKQYRATFKSISPNMNVETNTEGVKEPGTLENPEAHARALIGYFVGLKSTPGVTTPGNKNLLCPVGIPKLPLNACYNTVSVGFEKNYSDGTATAIIDQSTEPTNCDGDGYIVEWSSNVNKNKRAHAELFGWSNGAVVQDLNCEATETVDINVNVSSKAKCLVSELKDKAKNKFDELTEKYQDSATMTKHNLSINSGRCSITASFIMSKGNSVTT